jgi:hypothetical protein
VLRGAAASGLAGCTLCIPKLKWKVSQERSRVSFALCYASAEGDHLQRVPLPKKNEAWLHLRSLQVCRNITHYGPWLPVRGRCVPFRKAQQSCNAFFAPVLRPLGTHRDLHTAPNPTGAPGQHAAAANRRQLLVASYHVGGTPKAGTNNPAAACREVQAHARHAQQDAAAEEAARSEFEPGMQQLQAGLGLDLWPQYAVDVESGRPPTRPLLCGPGLVCTGESEPLPHTCVKARPPNVCYQVGRWC